MTCAPAIPRFRAEAKARTRQAILTAARAAFELKGFSGVDIRTIARAAGLSTGAVYGHFDGKAPLFEAAMGRPAPTEAMAEAAAELLAALKDVLPYANACIGRPRSCWPTDSVILAAERAIAKAEAAQALTDTANSIGRAA